MTSVAALCSTGFFNYSLVDSVGVLTDGPMLSCFIEFSCPHANEFHIALAAGPVNKHTHWKVMGMLRGGPKNTLQDLPYYEVLMYPWGKVCLRRAANGSRNGGNIHSADASLGVPFTYKSGTQTFWLEFNRETGRFCFGAGDVLGQTCLIDWTDPQPLAVEFAATNIYDNSGSISQAMRAQSLQAHLDTNFIKCFRPLRWSAQQHTEFPAGVRSQARELLNLGWMLARTFAQEQQALVDCWVEGVMPHALGLSHSTRFAISGDHLLETAKHLMG